MSITRVLQYCNLIAERPTPSAGASFSGRCSSTYIRIYQWYGIIVYLPI